MGVQAFRPELAVERLDEAIIGRLAGAREIQGDVVCIGPEVEVAADELAAIVDPDRLRIAKLATHPFQGLHDVLAAIGEPRIGRGAVAGMDVDDGQNPQLLAQSELVMDEIHRPDLIRPSCLLAIFAQLRLHPPLGMLVPELQVQLIVNPAGLLDVHLPTLPAQQHVHATITVAHARLAYLPDPPFEAGLTRAAGLVMVARCVEPKSLAGPADRHAPSDQHPVDKLALPGRPQSFRRMTS